MTTAPRLTDTTQRLCQAFSEGLIHCLGSKLVALYVYGAAVFPETQGTGDVDLHAIIKSVLTPTEKDGILALQRTMAKRFPPLGEELDAYVILLADAKQSGFPVHQLDTSIVDNAWALHRAHWLAGWYVGLHGPEPAALVSEPTWEELDEALQEELAYVEEHLAQYPGYGIMNLCRLMYSYRTRNVVTSKFGASAWAMDQHLAWKNLIDLARRSYTQGLPSGDNDELRSQAPLFFTFAKERINATR